MIRIAKFEDLPAVVTIYKEAVASRFATADTVVVTVDLRRDWFIQHEPITPSSFWEDACEVRGWSSLKPIPRGRMALRFTAEISYYVRVGSHRKGIASGLIRRSFGARLSLQIKNLFAIVREHHMASRGLLEKLEFEKWCFLPSVADFDGQKCGHVYYGRRILW